jgi:hypothetical protein
MISIDNYYKKTPRVAKMIGDILLFSAPLLSGVIMAAPFAEPLKSWLLFGINMTLVIGKIITKFIGSEEITDNPNPDL